MLQAGRTTRDVAHELQVSQSHVARLRKKRLYDLPASSGGRPQVLSDAQKRVCVRVVTSGVFEIATQVAQHVRKQCHVIVSVDTVQRTLHATGLRSKVKQKHIKDPLEFARRHQHWTVGYWKHVIFSDEIKAIDFAQMVVVGVDIYLVCYVESKEEWININIKKSCKEIYCIPSVHMILIFQI